MNPSIPNLPVSSPADVTSPGVAYTAAVTPPAPAPKDNGIRSWQINGRGVRVQAGTLKSPKKRGFPTFRFIFSPEDPNVPPGWADVTNLVATLDVADQLAVVFNKEVLRELAAAIAEAATEVTPEGVRSINTALIAVKAKEVVAAYLAEKEGTKTLLEDRAALSEEYRQLAGVIVAAALAGRDVNKDPELKATANKVGRIALEIAEIEKKIEAIKTKKNKGASAATAAPTTATAPTAPAVAK
jgi:hypothetical protein